MAAGLGRARVLLPGQAGGHRSHAASPQRPYPVDLLLCGHHYRACEMALPAAGATVYDETGIVLPAGEEPVPAPPAAWTR